MKRDVINDVSTLTFIDRKYLDKLINKSMYSIGDASYQFACTDDTTLELDIGIGILMLVRSESSIKYRFIPSQKLEKTIIAAICENKNILTDKLETNLISKIENIYKELL